MNDLQILVTTILGTLLVLVAVWMIAVRRDPARNTAKFFGIELDLSTPGLVVLVIGCGLVVVPAFVPHRPGGLPLFLFRSQTSPGDHGDVAPVLWQQTVVSSESETNDTVGSANRIELGQTIAGTLVESESAVDYFALASSTETRGPRRFIVRTRGPASGCCVQLTVWNEKEEQIARNHTTIGGTISVPAPPADAYLVRVSTDTGGYDEMNYEFLVTDER